MSHPLQASDGPIRNTPIRIIVDQNADRGTGGYQRAEYDAAPIAVAAALTVIFALIALWLYRSRRTPIDHSARALRRVARGVRLSRDERLALQAAAERAGVEPAAALLSPAVLARVRVEPVESADEQRRLVSVRSKLLRLLGQGDDAASVSESSDSEGQFLGGGEPGSTSGASPRSLREASATNSG